MQPPPNTPRRLLTGSMVSLTGTPPRATPPAASATCHTTTNWLGATCTHNFWSVNHGNANGVCATCHTTSTNYTAFVCSNNTCHPQSQINNTHKGISNYA